jgi:2-polyprenyl-3-methyl-5-hydroxy-6-metoxy-1,4-benzoquinol methylase
VSDAVAIDTSYTGADHAFRDLDPYARAKYDVALRWLERDMTPGRLVYNIGCGAGYFNTLVAEHGHRVVACEPDPEAYAQAVTRAGAAVTVMNCGLEAFAKDREPADIVVMHDVLEHIEDDRAAVEALAKLVKPGGALVVSVPAMPSLFGLHDELLGHYRRYTAPRLLALLRPRFAVERWTYYGMLSIPLVLWFSRWRRRPYPVQAGSTGWLGRAYALMCDAESHVPEPIGTSITALARPRT